ncbi:hypothetical protein R3P38DRAFT_2981928 [Favolaschia claudopus]|uniref:Uncharacterized protein n=1 Tax=Favolaschia claudopus TaxID=2862362 RepID=A0AAW0AYC9_9AGAR
MSLVAFEPVALPTPIDLPLLHTFCGATSLFPFLNVEAGTDALRSVYFMCLSPNERDLDKPLEHLGKAPAVETVVFFSAFPVLSDASILETMARYAPNLQSIGFQHLFPCEAIGLTAARALAPHLKKFTALSSLVFSMTESDNEDDEKENKNEMITVELWSEACKTLSKITINGRQWAAPKGGRWSIVRRITGIGAIPGLIFDARQH